MFLIDFSFYQPRLDLCGQPAGDGAVLRPARLEHRRAGEGGRARVRPQHAAAHGPVAATGSKSISLMFSVVIPSKYAKLFAVICGEVFCAQDGSVRRGDEDAEAAVRKGQGQAKHHQREHAIVNYRDEIIKEHVSMTSTVLASTPQNLFFSCCAFFAVESCLLLRRAARHARVRQRARNQAGHTQRSGGNKITTIQIRAHLDYVTQTCDIGHMTCN